MHKLILILGTGQGVLENKLIQYYRTADYYFENDPENIVKTPFIGEAIIKCKKDEFDEVFILGTTDSMWETLYSWIIGENATDNEIENFYKIVDSIKNRNLENEPELIAILENKLSSYYNVKTNCKIIPVGKSESEHWQTFEKIISIPKSGDSLSIDITHGLRYQPMILTISLMYLKTLKNINIKNVFYGALELSKSYFGEKTPIMNLNTIVNMIDWTNAAFSISRYGDTSVFSEVMNKETESEFLKRATFFSSVLQLNTVANIRTNAENLIKEANRISNDKNYFKAYSLIKESILTFPQKLIESKTDWELMLILSERHWQSSQYGLSILAAWEALMERMSDIYKLDIRNNMDAYKEISLKARKNKITKGIAIKIGKYRNSIAHAENDKSPDTNKIIETFPYYLKELKNLICNEEFEDKILSEGKKRNENSSFMPF